MAILNSCKHIILCYRLIIVFILAAALRFYQLGVNPVGLNWDEVAWGYNSYSLGVDGREEFGAFLPFQYLESYGDYKPPVYAYLGVIPVWIFGLNEFATRFPSALLGTLTVIVTYFLVKRIFYQSDYKHQYAYFSALFLAISPWHINLSRAAFEANVASFFLVTGIWAFLAGVKEKKWMLVVCALFFAISLYTFNTARIVAPILAVCLGVRFHKQLWERKKQTILAFIIGGILIAPLLPFLISPQASLRFKEVNIFSDIAIIERINQEVENDGGAKWSKIIHHRYIAYEVEYIKHFLDNFDFDFLFIKGDRNPKFSTQDVGQMYLWDLPFFLLGILFLFKRREKNFWIIPVWLLIGIIPAATARETPHALRIEASLPTFQILTAYGFSVFILSAKNLRKNLNSIVTNIAFFLLFLNFLYYLHGYYVHYPYEYSGEWNYGYKPSIEYVKSVEGQYDEIYVSEVLGRPYMYYLFYTKTHPQTFRDSMNVYRDAFGFVHLTGFGKYKFGIEKGAKELGNKKILYISGAKEVAPNAHIKKTFYALDKNIVLTAYTLP